MAVVCATWCPRPHQSVSVTGALCGGAWHVLCQVWGTQIQHSPQPLLLVSSRSMEGMAPEPFTNCLHLLFSQTPSCTFSAILQYSGYMLEIWTVYSDLVHTCPGCCRVHPCVHRAGNEPDLLAVYLFCYAGRADLTQKVMGNRTDSPGATTLNWDILHSLYYTRCSAVNYPQSLLSCHSSHWIWHMRYAPCQWCTTVVCVICIMLHTVPCV